MNETNSSTAHADPSAATTMADQKFLIVGIGASAGGIEALKTFFEQVPDDSGMAYVVILHLSPDHDSRLAEVLQQVAKIPVAQVKEKVQVQPNQIYVISPNQHLMMMGDVIEVSPNVSVEDRRAPVDIFFRTLAESQGPKAISVVLSGTGANGSMGLKRVKECGGAAFVQNPREAEFSEMPRNSIATDMVDQVLPVADMPARLIAYRNSLGNVEIADEAERRPELHQQALREIFTQLRIRTGHDFTNYKRPTLLRRIERRINICGLPDLPAYAAFVHDNLDETRSLLKDLLISVTNFFRDKKAFESLEQDVLPRIFQGKTAKDEVRIWVAGCATGEEAYSLAMLCAERTLDVIDAPKVQIFGTDIDEAAIAHARDGFYTLNDAADVSSERLRRFFGKEGEGYRIRREIREMTLFAVHNVIKDPPFSHLDLVTCRNMLIYLNQTAQEQLMETFHFALNPGGFLFLGTSESADGANDLYTSINREQRIYQSRRVTSRTYPIPESVPTFRFDLAPAQRKLQERERRATERVTFGDLHHQLLEQYAPPSVVVNEVYDIVHVSEHAGRYLRVAGGEPSNNLLDLVRPELRLELRSGLYQAVQNQSPVEIKSLQIRIDEQDETLNIYIRPVMRRNDIEHGFILVLFEQVTASPSGNTGIVPTGASVAHQIEEELIRVKSQLHTSIEQYEFQAEELKASNEELQAMNEELRSAAEELETSKEELQSINEELSTVNQELKIKIEEATLTRNNIQNLINSADIGTIFLDRNFRVNLFTPAARTIFNLIPSDFGRPLSDITHRLVYSNLISDADLVLEKLQSLEREVRTTDGQSFLMHVLPYRTSEDHIDGVVITFVNINALKIAEAALRDSEERLRLLIEGIKDYAIFSMNTLGLITSWNTGAEHLFGWSEAEAIGQSAEIIFTAEDRKANVASQEMKVARDTGRAPDERFHIRKDGSKFFVSGVMSALYKDGILQGYVKIARDLTERNYMEGQLREAHDLLEQRIQERTAQLNDINDARRALLRKMVMTQEEERTRIAHELHDRTAQHLTSFIYSLSMLRQSPQAEPIRDTLNELLHTARDFMEDLHTVVQGLRPPLLDLFGLVSALQDYAQKWAGWSGIKAKVENLGIDEERLPPEIETTIYRIVQEALTNVVRHGIGATEVNITIVRSENEVLTMVEDNGSGFDVNNLAKLPPEKRRLGILGMQERAELMNGSLTIESHIGKGTVISLQLPLSI